MKKLSTFIFVSLLGFGLGVQNMTFASTTDEEENLAKEKSIESEVLSLRPVSEEGFSVAIGAIENNSHAYIAPWVFPDHTLEIVDSYVPFIFRTKKSASIEELKVIISVNARGKLSGFEILNEEVDKGLRERVGYMLRQMPNAVPVPGFQNYDPIEFELVIKK